LGGNLKNKEMKTKEFFLTEGTSLIGLESEGMGMNQKEKGSDFRLKVVYCDRK